MESLHSRLGRMSQMKRVGLLVGVAIATYYVAWRATHINSLSILAAVIAVATLGKLRLER